jgi:hypothetical protein
MLFKSCQSDKKWFHEGENDVSSPQFILTSDEVVDCRICDVNGQMNKTQSDKM